MLASFSGTECWMWKDLSLISCVNSTESKHYLACHFESWVSLIFYWVPDWLVVLIFLGHLEFVFDLKRMHYILYKMYCWSIKLRWKALNHIRCDACLSSNYSLLRLAFFTSIYHFYPASRPPLNVSKTGNKTLEHSRTSYHCLRVTRDWVTSLLIRLHVHCHSICYLTFSIR